MNPDAPLEKCETLQPLQSSSEDASSKDETTSRATLPGAALPGRGRKRLSLRDELSLALLPTLTILVVFAVVERLGNHRLLFASLASSAFLIYLDPQHGTNSTRTLLLSQGLAALTGFAIHTFLGSGYVAAACSMVIIIVAMIVLDAVHPPAVSTVLAFTFRTASDSELLWFCFAAGMVAILVVLQRFSVWLVARSTHATN